MVRFANAVVVGLVNAFLYTLGLVFSVVGILLIYLAHELLLGIVKLVSSLNGKPVSPVIEENSWLILFLLFWAVLTFIQWQETEEDHKAKRE